MGDETEMGMQALTSSRGDEGHAPSPTTRGYWMPAATEALFNVTFWRCWGGPPKSSNISTDATCRIECGARQSAKDQGAPL